jgi:hypothetical protein
MNYLVFDRHKSRTGTATLDGDQVRIKFDSFPYRLTVPEHQIGNKSQPHCHLLEWVESTDLRTIE